MKTPGHWVPFWAGSISRDDAEAGGESASRELSVNSCCGEGTAVFTKVTWDVLFG